jgi:asparagine synthase (glutamine-hydrolysing)
VLLRAYQHWQCEVVDHLRGMFAFAIWDAPRERLLLARDRFGEKPLYLCENAHGLYFASEIKALLRVPGVRAAVDLDAVGSTWPIAMCRARKRCSAASASCMPGTTAVWERGALAESRYWSPPDRRALDPGDADGGRRDVLVAPGRIGRLQMVSDVPFGAFLSGGLDSSMIVALMSRHSAKVNTFSIGFGDPAYSELGYAAHSGAALRHRPTTSPRNERDLIERLPALVAFRDAPVSEPSDIPIHMLACAAARSVKMVLTGEGSDEVLGGYPKHVAERFYAGLPAAARRPPASPHRAAGRGPFPTGFAA